MTKPLTNVQRIFLAEAGRMGRRANPLNGTVQSLLQRGLIEKAPVPLNDRSIGRGRAKWVTTAAGDAELKRMREAQK